MTAGVAAPLTPLEFQAGVALGAVIGAMIGDKISILYSGKLPWTPPYPGPPGGTVIGWKQTRRYNAGGWPGTDIDTGHDHGAEGSKVGDPHAHDWKTPAGGGRPTKADRGPPRKLKPGDPPAPTGPPVDQPVESEPEPPKPDPQPPKSGPPPPATPDADASAPQPPFSTDTDPSLHWGDESAAFWRNHE